MGRIRLLIIEDDHDLAEDLRECLEDLDYEIAGVAHNLKDAYGLFHSEETDLVIADIMLGDEPGGITFAERIAENPTRQRPLIFLTGMEDQEIFKRAKATQPFAYLLKPFNIMELKYAIELSIEKFAGQSGAFSSATPQPGVAMNDRFYVKKGNHLVKLEYGDIRYVQVEGKYSDLYTEKDRFTVQLSLKDISQKLPDSFQQVHRNYLMNLDHLKKFNYREQEIIADNDARIPVSKREKENLMKRLNLLG